MFRWVVTVGRSLIEGSLIEALCTLNSPPVVSFMLVRSLFVF